jgi:molybdate transport system regulatory protein
MKISARNSLAGTVEKVVKGAVNAEVDLVLPGGDKLVAIITNESVESLGLKPGVKAYAIVKASWVVLAQGLDAKKISARNVLAGTVASVQTGAVNDEIKVTLSGGSTLTAVITRGSSEGLGLKQGLPVQAIFKSSSVILAVD